MKIYLCKVCGHVEFGSAPDNCPVCRVPKENFDQNDNLFKDAAAKSAEGAVKHIPSITVKKDCKVVPEEMCTDVLVRIGETLHPMMEDHLIVFVDCYVDDNYVSRIYFTPKSNPAVIFHLKEGGSKIRIVEFCNKHGHWEAEADM